VSARFDGDSSDGWELWQIYTFPSYFSQDVFINAHERVPRVSRHEFRW